jgi:toxin ParE1/3/4
MSRAVVVPDFRLSERAAAELLTIYADSESRFGSYQAEAYLAGLERIFGLLADFPRIGQDAAELRPGYRRFRFQAHIVFYSEDADGVFIRAIVHGARDIRPPLFD